MSDVRETWAACDHRESPDPRNTGSCMKCSYPFPAWYLTEAHARDFYDAIGAGDLADHAIERLRMGRGQYKWTGYLERDNVPEGIDEMVDGFHYSLFEMLRSYLLETENVAPDRAERARIHLMRAAHKTVEVVREFQAAGAELKS